MTAFALWRHAEHAGHTSCIRKRKLYVVDTQVQAGARLDVLKRGMFVILLQTPDNFPEYQFPYVVAEIRKDVSHLDTTVPDTEIEVQVYCPTNITNMETKLHPWKGRGEGATLWKPTVARSQIKGIVELMAKGKKLTAASKKLICGMHLPLQISSK